MPDCPWCGHCRHALDIGLALATLAALPAARRRAQPPAERRQRTRQLAAYRRFVEQEHALTEHPERLLLRGFERLAAMWDPRSAELIAGGAGIGRADLRRACDLLTARTLFAPEHIQAIWQQWSSTLSPEHRPLAQAVHGLLLATLDQLAPSSHLTDCPAPSSNASRPLKHPSAPKTPPLATGPPAAPTATSTPAPRRFPVSHP